MFAGYFHQLDDFPSSPEFQSLNLKLANKKIHLHTATRLFVSFKLISIEVLLFRFRPLNRSVWKFVNEPITDCNLCSIDYVREFEDDPLVWL